jgi:ABC-type dipeptide/oligopeptide/nickel transport system permease subunit
MTDQQSSRPLPGDVRGGVAEGPPSAAAMETHAQAIAASGAVTDTAAVAYETGLAIKARSQWSYALRRFLRHRLAVGSLIVLLGIFGAGIFANHIASYQYDQIDLINFQTGPTFNDEHFFGTDVIGRDYFTRVLYGIRTSARVALIVSLVSTFIGTMIGAMAGYFGGWLDNLLMRLTDLILVIPLLAILLTASALLGEGSQYRVAVILGLLLWTTLARIVRGVFLSLREKEYVEAAKASGSGDLRIIVRHMLPNAVGPIIVNATLTVAIAILLESALSFLGFGIKPPTPALGKLIADGQNDMLIAWWLVTFPGLVIVAVVLCINFIGDGLRDALDPTQRRVRA